MYYKRIVTFVGVLMGVFFLYPMASFATQSNMHQNMKHLSNIDNLGHRVSPLSLPAPYNDLLTQPLMTKGIETYYHRTPIVEVIHSKINKRSHTYFRTVLLLLDINETRNNPKLAQKKKETAMVELAFITMNFNALPDKLIQDVLHTKTPFGQLLVNHAIQTVSKNRSYFSLTCNKELSSLTQCHLNSKLYGRTHTLIRADNHEWVARVTEILFGSLRD